MKTPRSVSAQEVMALRRTSGMGVLDAQQFLENAEELLYRRILEALNVFDGRHLLDPTEQMPEYASSFQQANEMAEEELQNEPHRLGRCHIYWSTKKRILHEQFGIEWYTPVEMNPGTYFD